MNTGWWEIDIHGCYSLVKIAFAPICACENNRRIWRHNASISRSRDVPDPLWWRHNAKSETTVPGDNCKISVRWLFLAELCVQDIKHHVRNKIIHSLPWITIFGSLMRRFANDFQSWLRHSWKSLANRPSRDTKIVIHGNSCIILYVCRCVAKRSSSETLWVKIKDEKHTEYVLASEKNRTAHFVWKWQGLCYI